MTKDIYFHKYMKYKGKYKLLLNQISNYNMGGGALAPQQQYPIPPPERYPQHPVDEQLVDNLYNQYLNDSDDEE